MGILIDIILVAIVVISAFLGYKKGLVELGAKLIAGLVAIILTLIIFKPIGNVIIKNTSIDEKIENVILENTKNFIDENSQVSDNKYIQSASDNAVTEVKENILPEQARNIAVNVVYVASAIIIFIVSKIVLSIIITLANAVASLPILKQFNEIGGLLYGIIRGAVISFIIILIIGTVAKMNPNGTVSKDVESTILVKEVYNNVIKIK
ncbi:MAG: CvpA family protein [Clostridia bacterium]